MTLLSLANVKTRKGEKQGVLTAICHLAPCKLSGFQACPFASKGCAAACLNRAGRGAFRTVQDARINRTRLLFSDPQAFHTLLDQEISAWIRKAQRKGMSLAIRLNGTSDIDFRAVWQRWPNVTFYDYTKRPKPFIDLPPNVTLVYSLSERPTSEAEAMRYLNQGHNVAVVFRNALPKRYLDRRVIDGDKSDTRHLDPKGVIVGLKAKGPARKDQSGFVKG
jgi:hypothetical protein